MKIISQPENWKPWWVGQHQCPICRTEFELERADADSAALWVGLVDPASGENSAIAVLCPNCKTQSKYCYRNIAICLDSGEAA